MEMCNSFGYTQQNNHSSSCNGSNNTASLNNNCDLGSHHDNDANNNRFSLNNNSTTTSNGQNLNGQQMNTDVQAVVMDNIYRRSSLYGPIPLSSETAFTNTLTNNNNQRSMNSASLFYNDVNSCLDSHLLNLLGSLGQATPRSGENYSNSESGYFFQDANYSNVGHSLHDSDNVGQCINHNHHHLHSPLATLPPSLNNYNNTGTCMDITGNLHPSNHFESAAIAAAKRLSLLGSSTTSTTTAAAANTNTVTLGGNTSHAKRLSLDLSIEDIEKFLNIDTNVNTNSNSNSNNNTYLVNSCEVTPTTNNISTWASSRTSSMNYFPGILENNHESLSRLPRTLSMQQLLDTNNFYTRGGCGDQLEVNHLPPPPLHEQQQSPSSSSSSNSSSSSSSSIRSSYKKNIHYSSEITNNPLDTATFTNKYNQALQSLLQRMDRSSQSRKGFEEVKRQLNQRFHTQQQQQRSQYAQLPRHQQDQRLSSLSCYPNLSNDNNMDRSYAMSALYPSQLQVQQQSCNNISYADIKATRRRSSKKTKSAKVKKSKKKMEYKKDTHHRRALSLKGCTPDIFG